MLSVAERFRFKENNIVLPSLEDLDRVAQLDDLGRLIFPSGIQIEDLSIMYDVIIRKLPLRTDVILTATCMELPIGFRDVSIHHPHNLGSGEGCFGKKRGKIPDEVLQGIPFSMKGIPYYLFRFSEYSSGGRDSLVVHPGFRGMGIGRSMFGTMLEIEKRLGVSEHHINIDMDETREEDEEGNITRSFYKMFAPVLFGYTWVFYINEMINVPKNSPHLPNDEI